MAGKGDKTRPTLVDRETLEKNQDLLYCTDGRFHKRDDEGRCIKCGHASIAQSGRAATS